MQDLVIRRGTLGGLLSWQTGDSPEGILILPALGTARADARPRWLCHAGALAPALKKLEAPHSGGARLADCPSANSQVHYRIGAPQLSARYRAGQRLFASIASSKRSVHDQAGSRGDLAPRYAAQ
jgi:hypothetical protein